MESRFYDNSELSHSKEQEWIKIMLERKRKEQWADLTICAIINMQEQCIGLNIEF